MSLDQWFTDFLNKRGIAKPDGRPLFAYKTSLEEFETLRLLLQNQPQIKQMHSRYSQAWLLFASEWWKREYAGGPWRWAPLFAALNHPVLAHEQTSGMVIDGHKQWCLKSAIKESGKRYIGLVAVNGGLPLRLVESSQGGLANLLRMVTEQALRFSMTNEQLRQAIENQAALLPSSYQQTSVYELLESIVLAVLHIQKSYNLTKAVDPILKLQEECPTWEDFFPMTLDNTAAATLIKGLVRSTAATTSRTSHLIFQIKRGLRFSSDGAPPQFELSFEMQTEASRVQIAECLGISAERLPPNFQLYLSIGEREYLVGEAMLRDDKYKLIAKPLPLIKNLYESAQLIVSRWGATIHLANLPGGEALSYDEPIILENNNPFARFIAQGDTVLKGQSALALIPAKAIVLSEDGDALELYGDLVYPQKLMQFPPGITRIVYQRQSFTININVNAAQAPEVYWQGKTLEAPSVPGLIFCGLPRLRVEGDAQTSYAPSHELYVRLLANDLPFSQSNAQGLCRLIWRKDGHNLTSTRAVILPPGASIVNEPGTDPHQGIIRLINWPEIPVRCDDEDIDLESYPDGNDLLLRLKNKSNRPVITISLIFQWLGGEQKMTLPFPGYGVTLLQNNIPLYDKQVLTINELYGCRALLMSAQGAEHWQIHLSTAGHKGRSSISQYIKYIGVREIRLFELIDAVQQMLSCYHGLDHQVQLDLMHAHQTIASLYIGRYSTQINLKNQRKIASLKKGKDDFFVEKEQAEGLILALPLAEPDHDPVCLPMHYSEQVFTGDWLVNLPFDAAGPWLLYTPNNSLFHIRPTIVPPMVNEISKSLSPLQEALCIADSTERMHMLRNALQGMTANLYDDDWQILKHLLERLHHLPLASLDICKALIQEPLTLSIATLSLDDCASQMAERLPLELPFEWLLIAPDVWFDAFNKIRAQPNGGNDSLLSSTRDDIQRKSLHLSRWQPALAFIFEQGLHRDFGLQCEEAKRNVELFQKYPSMLTGNWLNKLFDGAELSEMQRMLHRNPAETNAYPRAENSDIAEFLKTKQGQLLLNKSKLHSDDFKLTVVILPFMAAYDAYAGKGKIWQEDPVRLFSLRNVRQFDTVWFDLAYQTGLAMAQSDTMQK